MTVRKIPKYVEDVPEGGWGYMITLSLAFMLSVTANLYLVPFGMIFGDFLASIGDETEGTTLTNGIFNTVMSFMGLVTNKLITKYSKRKVGIAGSIIFFIGSFLNIFVTSLIQFIISFGIIQGIGFGLMMAASFSAFNEYFVQRKSVMMALAQAGMVLASMACPFLIKILRQNYGFRGTVAILSAISLNGILSAIVLQPVKWHMVKRKVNIPLIEMQNLTPVESDGKHSKENEHLPPVIEDEPLMEENKKSQEFSGSAQQTVRPRLSIVSMGSLAMGIDNTKKNEELGFWESISESMDLKLLKEPVFVNIAFGLSLGFTSDLAFLSMIPLLLTSQGYDMADVTLCLTIFFAFDLASRILLSVVSVYFKFKNRHLFLIASVLTIVFRIGFTAYDDLNWLIWMTAILGFLRAYIQTPLPLVLAEQYPIERFTAAFSLYMVICGLVALVVGPLIGFVKLYTGSNKLAAHVLTLASFMCAGPWAIELFYTKFCSKKK